MQDSFDSLDHPDIKKIIDPKSGFSLYIKPIKNAPIDHVSTGHSFSPDMSDNNNLLRESLDALQKKMDDTHASYDAQQDAMRTMVQQVVQKNKQLMMIIAGLVIAGIASILF